MEIANQRHAKNAKKLAESVTLLKKLSAPNEELIQLETQKKELFEKFKMYPIDMFLAFQYKKYCALLTEKDIKAELEKLAQKSIAQLSRFELEVNNFKKSLEDYEKNKARKIIAEAKRLQREQEKLQKNQKYSQENSTKLILQDIPEISEHSEDSEEEKIITLLTKIFKRTETLFHKVEKNEKLDHEQTLELLDLDDRVREIEYSSEKTDELKSKISQKINALRGIGL